MSGPQASGDESARNFLKDGDILLSLAEESAGIGIWDQDLVTGLTRATPQFFRIVGLEPTSEPVPQDVIRSLRHPDDRDRVVDGYRQAQARGDDTYECEYRIVRPDGEIRWIFGRGRTGRDAAGTPIRYSGVDIDITERKRAEEALRISEARLDLSVRVAGLGIFDHDHRSDTTYWSHELRAIGGWKTDEPSKVGGYLQRVHPDDREIVSAAFDTARAPDGDGTVLLEHRLQLPDGTQRWVAIRARTLFETGHSGRRPTRTIGVVLDITDRRKAEEHVRLLMREVNHRSNNLLTVVQAVAQQTAARSEPAKFAELLAQRIAALSASHNLLVSSEWQGAPMADLVRSQLSHFADLVGTRVNARGPSLRIAPSAAQAIGMALHELTTNALKYGALSNDRGTVWIEWDVQQDGEGGQLRLRWQERDGPRVCIPTRTGFGHTVMMRMMEGSLGGRVRLDFHPEGVVWEAVCPLDTVTEVR